jgi:hypothetical protein
MADRFEEPHASLGDQVFERQTSAAKLLRNVDDTREICRDQQIHGVAIAVARARDVRLLVGPFLSRATRDVPKEVGNIPSVVHRALPVKWGEKYFVHIAEPVTPS